MATTFEALTIAVQHHQAGRLQVAEQIYRQILAVDPDHADALHFLGVVASQMGNHEVGVEYLRRAIEVKPDFAQAHNNLGIALQIKGNLEEAVACFRRALEFNPGDAEAQSNLSNGFKEQGRLGEAIASYRRALELNPESCAIHSSLLYTLWFSPDYDSSGIYREHCRWSGLWAQPLAKEIVHHTNDSDPSRRLRIGYVSPDFRTHCQSFFTVPLFSAHDHQQFEIVCYSDVVCSDNPTSRLRSSVDHWREIAGFTDADVSRLVRQDQIDILVDLTMHMAYGRPLVFARKPAPVQVCWLAYPGTTGNAAIDYRLTDPFLDPPGLNDQNYVEESLRLADTFWCYDPLSAEPQVNSLPALRNGYVTFGCLNNFCKVNAGILKLWAKVLRAVAGSRLMLLAPEGQPRSQVLKEFQHESVERERVTFVSHCPRQQYLERYHIIDIGLDTLPYNGHTTSLDSLWMGVPIVTIVGQTVVGRAALSQLRNLGLNEFIAENPDEFVRIAVETASDLKRLSDLRGRLRGRMESSPLMDAPRFARSIEAAYRTIWQRWCARAS